MGREMPRNVEIKARVRDPAALERRVRELAPGPPEILQQEDVFFRVPVGRLKLRTFGDGSAELIHYRRSDRTGPAASRYARVEVGDGPGLKRLLVDALGTRGVVRKERRLYLLGQTRIHLDRVEGLGDFVELEVVLREDQTESAGSEIARHIAGSLGVSPEDLVAEAYVDLLQAEREPGREG